MQGRETGQKVQADFGNEIGIVSKKLENCAGFCIFLLRMSE